MHTESAPTITTEKPSVDLATYAELTKDAKSTGEIVAARYMALGDNNGNPNIITVDEQTGEETIVPVHTIGSERMSELQSNSLSSNRLRGAAAVNASIHHGPGEDLSNN